MQVAISVVHITCGFRAPHTTHTELLFGAPVSSPFFLRLYEILLFAACAKITTDSVKVGVFGATSPSGCSPAFNVKGSVIIVVPNSESIGVDHVVPSPWGDEFRFPKPACDPTIPVQVKT